MNSTPADASRILSIDLCNRGVGFVVLETPGRLVDWGIKETPRTQPGKALAHMRDLFALYKPTVLCVEDYSAPVSRRGPRARQITAAITALARSRGVTVVAISVVAVRNRFTAQGAFNKSQTAAALALRFPPLIRRLPPPRKAWMSEDSRMAIFDALAFAVTLQDGDENPQSPSNS